MASLMPNGKQRYTNNSGAPLSGGKVFTYAEGTTTPKATYSDQAGTVPNTNPVILNTRGEALIFWAGNYKVVVKDAQDNTIYTIEKYRTFDPNLTDLGMPSGSNLVGFKLSAVNAAIQTLYGKLSQNVSVRDFGAVGDGVTDDTASFLSAIAFCTFGRNKSLLVPGADYLITQTLDFSRIAVRGEGTDGDVAPTRILAGSSGMLMAKFSSGCMPENIKFDGQNTAKWGALVSHGANRPYMSKVEVVNCTTFGFVFDATQNGQFYGLTTYACGHGYAFYNGARNNNFYGCGGTGIDGVIYSDYDLTGNTGLPLSTAITPKGNDRNNFFGGIYEYPPIIIKAKNTSNFVDDGAAFNFYGVEMSGDGSILDTSGLLSSSNASFNFDKCEFIWKDQTTPFSIGTNGRINFTGKTFFSGGANIPYKGILQTNNLTNGIQNRDGTTWGEGGILNPPNGFGNLDAKFGADLTTGWLAFFSGKAETFILDGRGNVSFTGGNSEFRRSAQNLDAQFVVGTSASTGYTVTGATRLPLGVMSLLHNANYPNTTGACAFSGYRARSLGSDYAMYHGIADAGGSPHWAMGMNTSDIAYKEYLRCTWNGNFTPGQDNQQSCGDSTHRWSAIHAGSGTIQTSDEREKQQINDIDAAAIRAWAKVNYCQYKFNDAVALKDGRARWHFGVIAQKVKEAFESEGLDPFAYGILCYDEWDVNNRPFEKDPLKNDDEAANFIAAGGRYGVRYDEALVLECAYIRSILLNARN